MCPPLEGWVSTTLAVSDQDWLWTFALTESSQAGQKERGHASVGNFLGPCKLSLQAGAVSRLMGWDCGCTEPFSPGTQTEMPEILPCKWQLPELSSALPCMQQHGCHPLSSLTGAWARMGKRDWRYLMGPDCNSCVQMRHLALYSLQTPDSWHDAEINCQPCSNAVIVTLHLHVLVFAGTLCSLESQRPVPFQNKIKNKKTNKKKPNYRHPHLPADYRELVARSTLR